MFGTETGGENRARMASSIITGTLITGDDYSGEGVWKTRSQALPQNTDLLNLAKIGKAFRPVEGDTGWDPNELFVQNISGKVCAYPNPGNTRVSVNLANQFKGKVLIKIEDMNGQMMSTKSFDRPSEKVTISGIGSFAKDIYIINVQDQNGNSKKFKFVKNKKQFSVKF